MNLSLRSKVETMNYLRGISWIGRQSGYFGEDEPMLELELSHGSLRIDQCYQFSLPLVHLRDRKSVV